MSYLNEPLTRADFNRLIELFNRRCGFDVIGIPQEEHYALGRAINALRPIVPNDEPNTP